MSGGIMEFAESVRKWDVLEVSLKGPSDGNPFTDEWIRGKFWSDNEMKEIEGFYDGDGIYRVRFMPSFEGSYHFSVSASFLDAECQGAFSVLGNDPSNHGIVRVFNKFHMAYEDGTRYIPSGTTCYVWEMQSRELQEETLISLQESPFNKIRFCIFPKHYAYNFHDPVSFPYVGKPVDSSAITVDNFTKYKGRPEGNEWDYKRFNPEHFQHIERCIERLGRMGIEADLIVMHPYDRWGFSMMDRAEDDLYWHYVIARFAAYHNLWWSLANEYDFMPAKGLGDWEHYASLLCSLDKYQHLRSIHNGRHFYDYRRPWITHCSIQKTDHYRTAENTDLWREMYQKPVILDEIAYEGNIQHKWGSISAKELVRRYWEAACRGGYAQHGETYLSDDGILWWAHGGKLKGESVERIRFLCRILAEGPEKGLMPYDGIHDEVAAVEDTGSSPKVPSYCLIYFGFFRPAFKDYHLDDETDYQVDIIDTWEMTVTDGGIHRGRMHIVLPGKEYMALRLTRVDRHPSCAH